MQTKKSKKTSKSPELKAMELLSFKMRSEKELREKLAEYEYSPEEIETGIAYVKSYGYLNDSVYAEQYVMSKGRQKGRMAIRIELSRKGIADEQIEEALAALEEDEEDVIYPLLVKKAGEPHALEEKEYAKLFRFCAGRGFKSGAIHKALKKYTDAAEGEY